MLSEMALDKLFEAETCQLENPEDPRRARALLKKSRRLYERTIKCRSDPPTSWVVAYYRMSRVSVALLEYDRALDELLRARKEFRRRRLPPFLTAPFFEGSIRTRIGALYLTKFWRTKGDDAKLLLRKAYGHLEAAVSFFRVKPGAQSEEWIREHFTAHANLAAYYLAVKKPEKARDCLKEARELDSPLWEQDIYFVLSTFQVGLALLDPAKTKIEELTRLDALRVRVLTLLTTKSRYLSEPDKAAALESIQTFETLWRRLLLGARTSPFP